MGVQILLGRGYLNSIIISYILNIKHKVFSHILKQSARILNLYHELFGVLNISHGIIQKNNAYEGILIFYI